MYYVILMRHALCSRLKTPSMGHLGILIFIQLLNCLHIWGFTLPACEESQVKCRNGSCIPRLWVCDGDRDCEEGSDELRCRLLNCKKDEFACRIRRCVSLHFRCNGVDDCGDGSDEASCQDCTADAFLCEGTSSCVPRAKLCDGLFDCPDGQDEGAGVCPSAHPLTPHTCSISEFRCGDGQCVPHSWRCDHSPDCADGSDEDNCDQNECLEKNGGCSHLCVDQPMGFLCDCPSGMRLVRDTHCEEIDKCLDTDMCDQLCVHVNGTFTCHCREGYLMSPRTGECKAKGDVAQLVFSSSEGVQQVSTAATQYRELAAHLLGPGPVAALATNRTLYWAKPGQGSIYRVSMDGKSQKPSLVLKGHGSISGLAVDWIHKLLYWTNADTRSINVAPLDGSAQRLLIGGLAMPTGVAVEPLLGLLFWADCGSSPRIVRAYMDGQGSVPLVTSVIRNPVAISLDMPRQLLYWADSGMRTISRVGFEGQHRKTVVESNGYLDRPFGLAVFEGHLYWSEEATHSICSADKHNGSLFRILLSSLTPPGGLALVHPVLQPSGPAMCGSLKMVCPHRCVPDLFAEMRTPQFICIPQDKGDDNGHDHTIISQTLPVPAPALSDTTFAGILSLIDLVYRGLEQATFWQHRSEDHTLLMMFLSVLLVGIALWWWREEFRPSRTLTFQDMSLKESQDPLIQGPVRGPETSPVQDTLLKLDLDRD